MVYLTEKEEWLTRMEISIKESGRVEKLMGMEFLLIQMDPCILGNGRMINSMEKELSLGTTIKSNLSASLKMVKKQEMANLNLLEEPGLNLMVIFLQVNQWLANFCMVSSILKINSERLQMFSFCQILLVIQLNFLKLQRMLELITLLL